jgi:hypothetical protein
MKTPAGTECKYFYGDYHRGANHEECRLLGSAWSRDLCRYCPTPSINRANACESMILRGEIIRPVLAVFQKRVRISAFCEKNGRSGFDPHIGCGECHPVPPIFEVKK